MDLPRRSRKPKRRAKHPSLEQLRDGGGAMMVVVSGKLLVGWGLPAVWGKLTDTYGCEAMVTQ